jgi:hypothetical protein
VHRARKQFRKGNQRAKTLTNSRRPSKPLLNLSLINSQLSYPQGMVP